RPVPHVQGPRVLDRPGTAARTGPLRRHLHCGRARHLRRLRRNERGGHPARRAGSRERRADARLRHGLRHRDPPLRRPRRHGLRASVPLRAAHVDPRPPYQGPHRLNVVTGYLPSAARNMGHADQMEHDDRYDYADEYMDVVYKLWEGSWEDDAVVVDRES